MEQDYGALSGSREPSPASGLGPSGFDPARWLSRNCHEGLEDAIEEFRALLPGWWYTVGECQVSCDASCGPTRLSPDIALIPQDRRFDDGFHVDLPQPSTLAGALRHVTGEALHAKCRPNRLGHKEGAPK